MSEPRRRASRILALLGAVLALLAAIFVYAREEIIDPDSVDERAQAALADEQVRLAISGPIVDAIVDSGPSELVNARPVVESVVVTALGTAPIRIAFGEAAKTAAARLFEKNPNTLLVNLADVVEIAGEALRAVAPRTAAKLPKDLDSAHLVLLDDDVLVETISAAGEVRFLGLLLPPLAILTLLAAVIVAPDRRRGLTRAATALAGAAAFGLILMLVIESLLESSFTDPVVRSAVGAAWEAIFGDLQAWFLGGGVIAIVIAAAARYASADEVDPLAPAQQLAALARRRPRRASLGVLRGLAFAGAGIGAVLRPEIALRVLAVLIGAWLLYVGVLELLAILTPPSSREVAERRPRRRLAGRLLGAGGVAAVALATVIMLAQKPPEPPRPPGAPQACNGYAELCSKQLDELTLPATHNSMSAAEEPGWFAPNQRWGITRQLDDGIRGLLIDTHYGIRRGDGRGFGQVITDLDKENKTRSEVVAELGEETVERAENLVGKLAFGGEQRGTPEPFLCHVLCELGATGFDEELARIDDWMEKHPDEFVAIFIEDVVSPDETAEALLRSGLLRFAYVPEREGVQPSLGELIESNRRLLIMAENDNGGGKYPWYMQGFDYFQETPYTFHSEAEIEPPQSCRPNRGHDDDPFLLINNWIETIPRDPDLAGRINSLQKLGRRARACARIRGLTPNLIAVDYYDRGDVLGVANELNGIPPSEKPEVRTLP